MPAFALRFVGQESLPACLSEFDREQFFELSSADLTAIREQFRINHRLPAALMVMFMRVAGRPLDGFNVLPRNLLRYAAQALGTSPPSIASLRSIYKRSQTLYKHQLWAKTYLGLRDLQPADEAELIDTLRVQAEESSHPDDLAQAARQWLFASNSHSRGPAPARLGARFARRYRGADPRGGQCGSATRHGATSHRIGLQHPARH